MCLKDESLPLFLSRLHRTQHTIFFAETDGIVQVRDFKYLGPEDWMKIETVLKKCGLRRLQHELVRS